MSYSQTVEMAEGRAYVFHNAFPLDGRISAYPQSARGHSVSNCYLLKEQDRALLLDTGYAVHETRILEQLASVLDPETPLSLLPLRLNEFMSVGNAMAIARRFNVVECLAGVPKINEWLEFESIEPGRSSAPTLHTTLLSALHPIDLGGRCVEVMSAPIRLISTRWIYDPATRTLFTSDMFSHLWAEAADGPWMREADDVTTPAFVRSFLLNTRLLVARGRAHRRPAQGESPKSSSATTSKTLRRATAPYSAGAAWQSSSSPCSTRCWQASTGASSVPGTSPAASKDRSPHAPRAAP